MLRISTFTIFLISITLLSAYADSNGIWTYPRDITPGVFGEDESSNPSENYTFNHNVYFNEDLYSPTYFDLDNSIFYLDLNGISHLHRIVAELYFSPGTNAYYLNPAGTSRVGVINANTLQISGVHTDNIYVNENQINSISSSMIIDDTVEGSDLIPSYQSGSAYDSRFVNENQADSIGSSMITNNQIQEVDLEVTNSPTDDYILSYDSSSGGFTWVLDQMGDSTPDTIADDNWIQETEIVQNTLDDSEIEDNSLTASSLAPNSVGSSEIANNAVRSDEIQDSSVQEIDLDITGSPSETNLLGSDNSGNLEWKNEFCDSSGTCIDFDTVVSYFKDQWFQANSLECSAFCSSIGRVSKVDPEYNGRCTSGETRNVGTGVTYSYGSWGPERTDFNTAASVGEYCYYSGQRRDNDGTDRTVGCFCGY